jgi:protein disulfide-isomerase-like protein
MGPTGRHSAGHAKKGGPSSSSSTTANNDTPVPPPPSASRRTGVYAAFFVALMAIVAHVVSAADHLAKGTARTLMVTVHWPAATVASWLGDELELVPRASVAAGHDTHPVVFSLAAHEGVRPATSWPLPSFALDDYSEFMVVVPEVRFARKDGEVDAGAGGGPARTFIAVPRLFLNSSTALTVGRHLWGIGRIRARIDGHRVVGKEGGEGRSGWTKFGKFVVASAPADDTAAEAAASPLLSVHWSVDPQWNGFHIGPSAFLDGPKRGISRRPAVVNGQDGTLRCLTAQLSDPRATAAAGRVVIGEELAALLPGLPVRSWSFNETDAVEIAAGWGLSAVQTGRAACEAEHDRVVESNERILGGSSGGGATASSADDPTTTPVVELDADSFDHVVRDPSRAVLVEFFAPWCGHCKALQPEFAAAAAQLKVSEAAEAVVLASFDATAHRVPTDFGVEGYPTLYWVAAERGAKPQMYEGGRTKQAIVDWVFARLGPS